MTNSAKFLTDKLTHSNKTKNILVINFILKFIVKEIYFVVFYRNQRRWLVSN
jgi:hypothetical protein